MSRSKRNKHKKQKYKPSKFSEEGAPKSSWDKQRHITRVESINRIAIQVFGGKYYTIGDGKD